MMLLRRVIQWMEEHEPANAMEFYGQLVIFCFVLFVVLTLMVWQPRG